MPSREIPSLFFERLAKIIPSEHLASVRETFSGQRPLAVRINTLKISIREATDKLSAQGIATQMMPPLAEALLVGTNSSGALWTTWFDQGLLYRQSLSSQLPVAVLAPSPTDRVLDMCAAPGSKTSQLAAVMQNTGQIVALEAIRSRYYKLKAVLDVLGAKQVSCQVVDGRRFRAREGFDKIIVDVPCSSEGRFLSQEPKTFAFWSPRKIKEMVRKQRGLLLNATRLLKPGGTLVYSTCTFAPEENEGVLDWVLRKSVIPVEMVALSLDTVPSYPALSAWEGKVYDPRVQKALRVLPDKRWEGFFLARMVRLA